MKNLFLAAMLSLSLVGCATNDYEMYAENHAKIEIAKANADAERYKAMSAIAQSGDTSAKVAAVVALSINGNSSNGSKQDNMAAPQANTALQWASILVPGVTQIYGISANMRVAMNQSDNMAKVAVSTNDTFTGIAGKIQAPAANLTTNTTLSGTGVLGNGTYSTSANQANQTLSGTGVLGSGTYAPQANQTLSGTGSLGSGTYQTTDNHTVTPTPVVVNPPVVVTSTATTATTATCIPVGTISTGPNTLPVCK